MIPPPPCTAHLFHHTPLSPHTPFTPHPFHPTPLSPLFHPQPLHHSPQRGDLVAAQLRIAIDGATVLDTARKGRPVAFLYGSRPSGGVTKGLEEGIASMKAGM